MEPRPLPPRALLLRSDPGASARVPAAERACAEMAGPGVQGGKEVLRAGGHFKVLTIIEPRFLSLGYCVLSPAQCPPWRTCPFLACTPVAKEGDMSLCLTLSLCPQRCLNTVPVVLRAAGWRWLPQSLAQRLVGQQTGAACRPLHGAGGS